MSHFNQSQTRTNRTDQMTKYTEHKRNVCVPYNSTTLIWYHQQQYANKLADSIQTNDDDHEKKEEEKKLGKKETKIKRTLKMCFC